MWLGIQIVFLLLGFPIFWFLRLINVYFTQSYLFYLDRRSSRHSPIQWSNLPIQRQTIHSILSLYFREGPTPSFLLYLQKFEGSLIEMGTFSTDKVVLNSILSMLQRSWHLIRFCLNLIELMFIDNLKQNLPWSWSHLKIKWNIFFATSILS